MNPKRLIKLVNEQAPNGILCTTDNASQPNAAVVGSARLDGPDRLVAALTDSRTLANLRSCPKAMYICTEPGPSPLLWRGVRLSLLTEEMSTDGELFNRLVAGARDTAGDDAADRIAAAVVFTVTEVRTLLNLS